MVRLDVGLGLGKWVYTDDATGTYRDGGDDVTYTYALKDLSRRSASIEPCIGYYNYSSRGS